MSYGDPLGGSALYDAVIVATTNNLMCCQCSCQCRSKGDERIVCVHSMVRLYMLSLLLLHSLLAENMLCELTTRIVEFVESNESDIDNEQWLLDMRRWTEDELMSIQRNVLLLMNAAWEFIGEEYSDNKSLPDILQAFSVSVGTQKRKVWVQSIKDPPKPFLIWNLLFSVYILSKFYSSSCTAPCSICLPPPS